MGLHKFWIGLFPFSTYQDMTKSVLINCTGPEKLIELPLLPNTVVDIAEKSKLDLTNWQIWAGFQTNLKITISSKVEIFTC